MKLSFPRDQSISLYPLQFPAITFSLLPHSLPLLYSSPLFRVDLFSARQGKVVKGKSGKSVKAPQPPSRPILSMPPPIDIV